MSVSVGQRVSVKNDRGADLRGIVRFSGATGFRSGPWIGVELYVAQGKNDGSVQARHRSRRVASSSAKLKKRRCAPECVLILLQCCAFLIFVVGTIPVVLVHFLKECVLVADKFLVRNLKLLKKAISRTH